MYNNINILIKERSFAARMGNGGLDSWSNYFGPSFEGYTMGLSRSRDSDLMAESNFNALLNLLGGEGKRDVVVNKFGHWACGWIETIMVKNTAKKKLTILMDALNSLETYPLLDEDHFYELESDKRDEHLEMYSEQWINELLKFIGSKKHSSDLRPARFKQMKDLVFSIYQEDCSYCGLDSAWVGLESITRFIKCYEFKDVEKSLIGRALLHRME